MSKSRSVVSFNANTTLTPTKLNKAWDRLAIDLRDVIQQRYTYSNFTLDWTGLPSTGIAEDFIFRIKAPFLYKVVGIELVSYGAANVTGISIASSLTGFVTTSLTTTTGTKVLATGNFQAFNVSGAEATFTLTVTSTGAYTLGKTYLNVLLQCDRAPVELTDANIPFVASGEAVAAAKQNTGFTTYESRVTSSNNANSHNSIIVFIRRNIAAAATIPTSDRDLRIPSDGRRLNTVDTVHTGALTNNIVMTITDETGATVVTATTNGSGAPPNKTQGTSVNDTQTESATYTNPAKDYKLTMTRAGAGAAAISLAYFVLYMKG